MAVLRNLPYGIDATDLAPIYSEVSAAAIGLPRHPKSYKNKPWAYFCFKSQELKDAAMERPFTLRNKQLSWHSPDDVKSFCPRCSAHNHKAKDCDAFNTTRGRSPIKKSLRGTYERFKPAGINLAESRSRSRSRSQSRSRSRSRPRNHNSEPDVTDFQHDDRNNSQHDPKTPSASGSSSNSPKRVIYAKPPVTRNTPQQDKAK